MLGLTPGRVIPGPSLESRFRRRGAVDRTDPPGIVLLPLFGAVIYFLVRPPTAEEERAAKLRVATAAGSPSEELERLINLHEGGKIDDDEYARLKARIVG
jgi:hypothetical protein